MDGTVAVRGTATVEVKPDFAAVRFGVVRRDRSAETAVDDVAKRAGLLDRLLDALGNVVTNRVATSLTVGPDYHFDRRTGERIERGQVASREIHVEVRDPGVLGQLLRDAVSQAGATISGPWWRIDDDNEAHSEARRLASARARNRAEDYAAGLGVTLGTVVWVAEPGLRKGDNGAVHMEMAAMAKADRSGAALAGGDGEQPPALIDVVAEKVPVTATVEAAFAVLSQP